MKVKEIGEYPGRSGSNASQYVSAPSEIILPQDIDRLCLSCGVLVKVVGPVHEDGMQGNLAEVTLSDVAEHFGFSVAYTSRLIKASTGQGFSEWKKSMRLRKAGHSAGL